MGNDMSVFEEGEIEKDFWKAHGPKNESWTDFFSRSFQGLTKILMQPDRMDYTEEDVESRSEDTDFRLEVFHIEAAARITGKGKRGKAASPKENDPDGNHLAAALWQQRRPMEGHPPPPLVLYLHTNTRCLVDAKEVLPVCDDIGASLLAFDLPGCGHSDGNLTFEMTRDLDVVLQHATEVLGYREIILWARGMATAIAVEYCVRVAPKVQGRSRSLSTSSTSSSMSSSSACSVSALSETSSPWAASIKFVVLDSPFTSVKQMVVDGSKAIKCFGLAVPETLVRLACRIVRGQVRSRLGSDPFDLKPLRSLSPRGSGQPQLQLPPCHIFSAQQDDYIPSDHGREMSRGWELTSAGCSFQQFDGRHFGERDPGLLREVAPMIRTHIEYDKEREDVAALSTVGTYSSSLLLPSPVFHASSSRIT